MSNTLNEQKILREKRISSLQKDIIEITRIHAKTNLPENQSEFERRIHEKRELVNILLKQSLSNQK
ncbi:MAG: hypothetical protein PHX27_04100 [Candidatus ainarchaeum sp.]|nr:hypothetical protein [Candidatus ainarchaeum sp.]